MYWQCTDESLSPRRKQNHTTKFFTEVTQFYSFILSRRCLRRSGQSRREKNNKICVKIEFYFFSISSKNNVGGSVNHKIKKVWPYVLPSKMNSKPIKSHFPFFWNEMHKTFLSSDWLTQFMDHSISVLPLFCLARLKHGYLESCSRKNLCARL